MVLGDRLGQAEAQASSLAYRLGGEERLSDVRAELQGNARSIIDHRQCDRVIAVLYLKPHPALALLFQNCVKGVLQQVEQDLGDLHLATINGYLGNGNRQE